MCVTEQSAAAPMAHPVMPSRQRMFAAVRLEDLPSKTSHRLLKSVTWTEVDGASLAHIPLRQLVGRVARRGQRLVNLRAAFAWLSRRP